MIDTRSTRAYKLEKEKKELKKEVELLKVNCNIGYEELKVAWKYKSRCEKAIEYLLKNKLYCFKYDDEELFEITTDKKAKDDLLNILQGDDEEWE